MHKQEFGVVLTFGNFDGIHLGHKFAISTLKRTSQEVGLPSAILTFEPHPSTFLFNKNNFRLTNQEQKMELINSYGVDSSHIIEFNKDFSHISCGEFIDKVLIGRYNVKYIAVGKNCTFGHKKSGNILTLKEYSNLYGYSVIELESLTIDGQVCSSSLIREYLQSGEIEVANKLLGRPYQVSGIVTKGACRGREIGFPTINIPIEDSMIKPKFGTYHAKMSYRDEELFEGVVNIGMRPTFKDLKKPIIEMHVFNFNQDLYNNKVKIQLLHFIRPERKFHSIDALKKQINYDIIKAYELKVDL